ncbi:MAG: tetratricopeptide repeat protein [Thermodesulfovibrionales bacterium]
MKRLGLALLWVLVACNCLQAEDLYDEMLNRGLRNADKVSYFLMEEAKEDANRTKEHLLDAMNHSPDLPAVYFRLSWVSLTSSPPSIYDSIHYLMRGFGSYRNNFWWLFNLVGISYLGALLAGVAVLLCIILVRLPMDVPLVNHEIREDSRTAIVYVVALALSALGPLYFVAAIRIVTYVFFGALIALPLLMKPVEIFFSAGTWPELKALVAVNQGQDNAYALQVLHGKKKKEELFSLALAQKREGRYGEAITSYEEILSGHPYEAIVYNNLGNCYAILKMYDRARELYEKAVSIRPMASAYYNLSQLSREVLDFSAGDRYFDDAKRVSPDAVARFRALTSTEPNRFYFDEVLGMGEIWGYALRARGRDIGSFSYLPLWATPVAGIAALMAFLALGRLRTARAFSCRRCGLIICTRCERSLKWGNMCHDCFVSLVTLEKEPRDRQKKLQKVYAVKRRRRNLIRFLSLIMPGLHLIYTGKILRGAALSFFFLFFPTLLLLGRVYRFSIYPFSHEWIVFAVIIFTPLLYVTNLVATRRFLRGWV